MYINHKWAHGCRGQLYCPELWNNCSVRCPFPSIRCEGLDGTAEHENILQPNSHKYDWCWRPRCLTLSSRAWEGSFSFIELRCAFDGIVFPTIISLPVRSHYHWLPCKGRMKWYLVLLAQNHLRYKVPCRLRIAVFLLGMEFRLNIL